MTPFIPCGNSKCEHDRDNHYSEFASSGDVTKPASREKRYYSCLAPKCDCKEFVPEAKVRR